MEVAAHTVEPAVDDSSAISDSDVTPLGVVIPTPLPRTNPNLG